VVYSFLYVLGQEAAFYASPAQSLKDAASMVIWPKIVPTMMLTQDDCGIRAMVASISATHGRNHKPSMLRALN